MMRQSGMTSAAVPPFTVSTSPQIVLTGPSTAVSGQQPSVTFQLVNPYPVALAGSLTLTFAPSTSSGVNDPAVQFASGGRTIDFNIPANSTATPGVQLQTGTVAGYGDDLAGGERERTVNVTPGEPGACDDHDSSCRSDDYFEFHDTIRGHAYGVGRGLLEHA